MYDVKVLHLLDKVIESLEVIQQRTENIHCTNDFLDSATGTLLLDGVCMKLIATGEKSGIQKGVLNTARHLLELNLLSLENISRATGLSIDELKKLQQ